MNRHFTADTMDFDRRVLQALQHPKDDSRLVGSPWLKDTAQDITALGIYSVLSILGSLVAVFFGLKRRYGMMKSQDSQHHVDRLNRLAWLLDNSIRVPETIYHIELDPLIGLVSGIGDAVGALLSMVIVSEAARLRLPASILARMGFNVALEVLIGSIPIIGDVFDMSWKANARLFERYTTSSKKTITSSKIMIFVIMLIFAFISVMSIYVGFLILRKLWVVWVS